MWIKEIPAPVWSLAGESWLEVVLVRNLSDTNRPGRNRGSRPLRTTRQSREASIPLHMSHTLVSRGRGVPRYVRNSIIYTSVGGAAGQTTEPVRAQLRAPCNNYAGRPCVCDVGSGIGPQSGGSRRGLVYRPEQHGASRDLWTRALAAVRQS